MTKPTSPLRQCMLDDMKFRNISPSTMKVYSRRPQRCRQPAAGVAGILLSCTSRLAEGAYGIAPRKGEAPSE